MSLFDIYKAKQLGAGAGSLFDAKAGGKLNKDAWKKGFNKWDEEWEVGAISGSDGANVEASAQIRSKNFSAILPSTKYYLKTPTGYAINVFYYDADKHYLEFVTKANTNVVTPSNAQYFKISTSNGYGKIYKSDICINISGEHNGEYVPYNG